MPFDLELPNNIIKCMNLRTFCFLLLLMVAFLTSPWNSAAADNKSKPRAKIVTLDGPGYKEILRGPPDSVRMQSGYVVLAPNQSVGKHSTGHHEELLIVLEGQGEMDFADGTKLAVRANSALYCPPETEHNVTNVGHRVLRYVYVVGDIQ